jgi:hypothetical protein
MFSAETKLTQNLLTRFFWGSTISLTIDIYRIYVRLDSEAWLLNKSSCLAPALGVTKFLVVTDMIWAHFDVLLKSDLDVQQTYL